MDVDYFFWNRHEDFVCFPPARGLSGENSFICFPTVNGSCLVFVL